MDIRKVVEDYALAPITLLEVLGFALTNGFYVTLVLSLMQAWCSDVYGCVAGAYILILFAVS